MADSGSISPQWHHIACGHRGGRPKFNYGQMMAGLKKDYCEELIFTTGARCSEDSNPGYR